MQLETLERRTLCAAPSLVLFNTDTQASLGALWNGETIDIAKLGNHLSIRADAATDTGSVKFNLDSGKYVHTENVRPYAMYGDNSGKIYPWAVGVGSHSLSASGYELDNASGILRGTATVSFK